MVIDWNFILEFISIWLGCGFISFLELMIFAQFNIFGHESNPFTKWRDFKCFCEENIIISIIFGIFLLPIFTLGIIIESIKWVFKNV